MIDSPLLEVTGKILKPTDLVSKEPSSIIVFNRAVAATCHLLGSV